MASRKHPWSNAPSSAFFDNAPSQKRKFVPSPEKIREWAKESREGGRFRCPICGEFFSVTYGVWGTAHSFQAPEHYCKDCAKEHPTFRKAIK